MNMNSPTDFFFFSLHFYSWRAPKYFISFLFFSFSSIHAARPNGSCTYPETIRFSCKFSIPYVRVQKPLRVAITNVVFINSRDVILIYKHA